MQHNIKMWIILTNAGHYKMPCIDIILFNMSIIIKLKKKIILSNVSIYKDYQDVKYLWQTKKLVILHIIKVFWLG